jgi:PST family polysaccharide transporter
MKNDEYFSTDYIRSDLRSRAVKGAGATVFFQAFGYGVHMVGTVVLARLLTPGDFGLVTMVTAFSLLLMNFGVNGFTEAIIQQEEIHHRKISTLFWLNLGISVFLTLVVMTLSPIMTSFYKDPRLKTVAIAMALSIVLTGLSTIHLALLQRNMQFYTTSVNELSATVISIILAIVMALRGWGYWAIVGRQLALAAMTSVGAWVLCRWRPGLPALGTGVGSMVKFAVNVYGNFCMNYFSRNLDKILIGRFYGSRPLGYYDRAYHLFSMPANQLAIPLTGVAIATLSRLRANPEKYKAYYLKAISLLAFIGMPLSAVSVLIGNDLILLLLGPQWREAGKIFSVLGVCIGIMLIYRTIGWLHLSLGRADRWFRWGIIEFIVTALFFLGGVKFGPLGVAGAYAASFYFLTGPGLWYAGRPIQLKLSSLVSAIWKYGVSALASGLLCWFILHSIDFTANIFVELNVFCRILVSLILYVSLYLLVIVTSHQGTKPISQFISIGLEMVPGFSLRKSKSKKVEYLKA